MSKKTFRFQVSPSFAFNFVAQDYQAALEQTAEFGVTADTKYKVIAEEPESISDRDWREHLATAEVAS